VNTTDIPKRQITAEDIERADPQLRPKLVAQLLADFAAGMRRWVEDALRAVAKSRSDAEAPQHGAPQTAADAAPPTSLEPASTPPSVPSVPLPVETTPPEPPVAADSRSPASEDRQTSKESGKQFADAEAACARLRDWFMSLAGNRSPAAVRQEEARDEAATNNAHPILNVLSAILASLSALSPQPSEPIPQS
jgi:hypothetical protein